MQNFRFFAILILLPFTLGLSQAWAADDLGDFGGDIGNLEPIPIHVEKWPKACAFDSVAGSNCPLTIQARSVEFLSLAAEAVIFLQSDGLQSGGANKTSIMASSRLEDTQLLEQIDEEESALIEREIQKLSGARYEIPRTRAQLLSQIGLPDNGSGSSGLVEIASEDWCEILRVHVEMSLSVSAATSRFLLQQMGVASDPVVVETH